MQELPRELQLEITHLCNKRCLLCDHRIRYSNYKFLKKEQYKYIASCCEPADFHTVQFIGGEPLCHPHFEWLVDQVTHDFGDKRIRMITNGRFLHRVSERVLDRLELSISHYPGFNDDIVERFRGREYVLIRPAKEFWNPYRDPNLTEEVAKRVRAYHNPKGDIRVVGTKLYGCMLAEPTERFYHTDPVHVQFTKSWREDWLTLPTWKACQHCFAAIDYCGHIEGVPTDEDLTWRRGRAGVPIGEYIREGDK